MEDSGDDFPGFQTCTHKDEFEYRKPLSRLQRRAPCPLQIKPTSIVETQGALPAIGCNINSSSPPVVPPSFNSFYYSKDPIPLLSPLVLPSLLQSAYVQERNTAK
ncbi:hypothetical protein P3X46_002816 [Hevea brasiliensis]|uniref:Uncharacterized protein n=1 Tax=Hevea brasiliensis TaxID=3981 RepID=A0ABQ9N4Z2_HEVBR|nr:uncharacterized protein LOC110664651 [Hevea brasiliensis]KAJ9187353.1 hypothetical protein P3X46_002816 [Hevea brasiliensis]